MPELSTGSPPAGWYPDAGRPDVLRWWDGTAWTDNTRSPGPQPAASTASIALSGEVPLTRRQLREQVGPLTAGVPDEPHSGAPAQFAAPTNPAIDCWQPVAPANPQPVAGQANPQPVAGQASWQPANGGSAVAVLERPQVVAEAELTSAELMRRAAGYAPRDAPAEAITYPSTVMPPSGGVQTLSGWLLAVSPIWWSGVNVILTMVLPTVDRVALSVVSLLATIVLMFGLARTDGKTLGKNGYRETSPGWVLAPFVYFILRVVRTGRRSVPMLVAWTVLQTVLFGLVAVLVASVYFHYLSTGTPPAPATQSSQGGLPSGGGDTSSGDDPSVILTDGDRAFLMTPAGMAAAIQYAYGDEHSIASVDCEPFASQEQDALTTCLMVADGGEWDVTLRLTPQYDDVAYIIDDIVPHGGNSSGAVQS